MYTCMEDSLDTGQRGGIKGQRGPMGTVRNSKKTSNAWKHNLDLKMIRELELDCDGVMQKFNYTIYDEESSDTAPI